jgi:3-hydroxyisobutyrate dehydrogenase
MENMTQYAPTLAILGLGTMGGAMARTARSSGLDVVVWDRDRDRAAAFAAETGVRAMPSLADAAAQAEVVVTMVRDAEAVTSVATEHGLIAALGPGATWAQMSTIGVEATERIAGLVARERHDVLFVDAPVSGSKLPAERGTLLIFASGPDGAKRSVTPVFDVLGQRTLWLGPAGNGSRMKLVNNVLLAFTAEGVANAMALAVQLGLDPGLLISAFDGSPLVSAWEMAKFRRLARNEYSAEFALALALKDVRLALSESGPGRFDALSALADEWQAVVDQGLGDQDLTVTTRTLGG